METKVKLTVPVSPVKEIGMLSLKCQVFELEESHQISISRKVGGSRTEILSMDGHIQGGVDDRFFLATRRLAEGSVVHFLSVINVEREDEGEYFCTIFKLSDEGSMITITRDASTVEVSYFPKDVYPMCSQSPGPYIQGNTVTLNCTSEDSNQLVDIKWKRTNRAQEIIDTTEQVHNDGFTYSVHQFRLQLADNQAVFLCEITHPMFPDTVQTCHIGPLNVLPNPLADFDESNYPLPTRTPESENKDDNWVKSLDNIGGGIAEKAGNCKDVCDSISSGVSYWVIATVGACALAIFFLFIGIILAVKLHRRLHHHNILPPSSYHDDIYSEIHSRMDSNRVYMTLAKIDNPVNQGTQPNWKLEGNYTGTPIAIKP